MLGALKKIGCITVAAALLMTALPQAEPLPFVNALAAGYFLDIDGHPSQAVIERWASLGVAWGHNGYFYPDDHVTRAEFFTIANRTFGASLTAPINQYRDVPDTAWYYEEIMRSFAAGYVQGTSSTTMDPNSRITREEVVTLLAQIVGLYAPNAAGLSDMYDDADQIAGYARGFITAFTEKGWISAGGGVFRPKDEMTRAEIFELMDSIYPHVFSGSDFMSNSRLTGNLLIRYPGLTISRLTLDGDLVLGDGVGLGNISLRNCVINGRLIIRGGGPNSVSLSGTTVTEGAYIYNPNGTTRLVNVNDTVRMGIVTARTSTIFEGGGLSSVVIPDNALPDAEFVFRDVNMDSIIVEQAGANITVADGVVDNFRFLSAAAGSVLNLGSGAAVNYLEINAANVRVIGQGTVDAAIIGASGAVLSMTPRYVAVGPGITASVGGKDVSGGDTGLGIGYTNSVDRSDERLAVRRDAANIGGAGLTLTTSYQHTLNMVNITQDASSAVPVSDVQRLGYWVGFFVPVPQKYQDPVIRMSYTFEGGNDSIYSLPVVSQNSVRGVVIYLPVKADSTGRAGVIDATVYFIWGDATYENLSFKSDALMLAAPTAAQSAAMAGYFANASLRAYNKTTVYTGSEALRRLMEGDNALGLDLRGYERFDEREKAAFASVMFIDRAQLTSKKTIQEYINLKTAFIGALYAVNKATSAPEIQKIIEAPDLAAQLGIDTATQTSLYATLSAANRYGVATDLLTNRKTSYPDEPAAAAVFDKSVDDRRAKEVALLTSINGTSSESVMQKLLETKANADMIGIVVDSAPYKSASAATKLRVALEVVLQRPYTSLDKVKEVFESIIGTPQKPVIPNPEDDLNILAVEAPKNMTLLVGGVQPVEAVIRTSSGAFSSATSLTWEITKHTPDKGLAKGTEVAVVDSLGNVTGRAAGTATLTITSKVDPKKKATVTVAVVNRVPVTSVKIPAELDLSVGATTQVRAETTPADGTDRLNWSASGNTEGRVEIVSVSGNGQFVEIKGITPGFTELLCYNESDPVRVRAVSKVFVSGDEPGVFISPSEITVGRECFASLDIRVSPITLANRTLKWTAGDPSIVSVHPLTSRVRGEQPGVTVVRVEIDGSPEIYAECVVTVDPNMHGVTMDEYDITMFKKGIRTLGASISPPDDIDPLKELIWSESSGGKIIRLETDPETGETVARAMAPGTVTVTAQMKSDPAAYDSCTITVLNVELSVKLSIAPSVSASRPLMVGDTAVVTAALTTNPKNFELPNTQIDYYSSDPSVASVGGSTGIVTAMSRGTAIIYAVPQASGEKYPITVYVSDIAVKRIYISDAEKTILRGAKDQLLISFDPVNTTDQRISWSSAEPSKVFVQSDGTIEGIETTYEWVEGTSPIAGYTKIREEEYDTGEPVQMKDSAGTNIFEIERGSGATIEGPYTSMGDTTGTGTSLPVGTLCIRYNENEYQIWGVNDTQRTRIPIRYNSLIDQALTIGYLAVDGNLYNVLTSPGGGLLPVMTTLKLTRTLWNKPVAVTATSAANMSLKAVCYVTVAMNDVVPVTSIELRGLDEIWIYQAFGGVVYPSVRLNSGGIQPSNSAVTWESSDPNVATIVQSGGNVVLTPRNPGHTTITVRSVDDANFDDKRTIIVAPVGVSGMTFNALGGRDIRPNPAYPELGNDCLTVEPSTRTTVQVEIHPTSGATNKRLDVVSGSPEVARIIDVSFNAATGVTTAVIETSSTVGTSAITVTPINREGYSGNSTIPDISHVDDPNKRTGVYLGGIDLSGVPFGSGITASGTSLMDPNGNPLANGAGKPLVVFFDTTASFTVVVGSPDPATPTPAPPPGPEPAPPSEPEGPEGLGGDFIEPGGSSAFLAAPAGISFGGGDINGTLNVGEGGSLPIEVDITAKRGKEEQTSDDLIWEISGDPGISIGSPGEGGAQNSVTVSSDARRGSKAVITVTSAADPKIKAAIPVKVGHSSTRASRIRMRSTMRVEIGASSRLYPDIQPYDADAFTWDSSNPSVASVSQNGEITGLSLGRAVITLRSNDGKMSSRCTVTVSAAPEKRVTGMRVNRANVTLTKGGDTKLDVIFTPRDPTFKGVSWVSGDPSVARVDSSGRVYALSGGVTVISAISDDRGVTATCVVTVKVSVTSVIISEKKAALSVGDSKQLGFSIEPLDASTTVAKWSSSNDKVATVSVDGRVTAVGPGTCTITVNVGGRRATCKITVSK